MKRFFIAVLMVLSSVLIVGSTAAPASAAGCAYYQRGVYQDEYVTATKKIRHTSYLYWYDCGSYVEFDKYVVKFNNLHGYCGDIGGWRINPDIIAGYNPAEKAARCTTAYSIATLTWAPLYNYRAYKWDTNANRCIGSKVVQDNVQYDDAVGTYGQLCMTFF